MQHSNPFSAEWIAFPVLWEYSEDTSLLRNAEHSKKQGIIFGFVLLYLKTVKIELPHPCTGGAISLAIQNISERFHL